MSEKRSSKFKFHQQ